MLNSLFIQNFKSLKQLEIPKLGNVNLIIGENNSGKSSVLDALKLYASFVDETVLIDIINEHDDFFLLEDDSSVSPYESLFFGRRFEQHKKIVIGELKEEKNKQLIIEAIKAINVMESRLFISNTQKEEKNIDDLSEDILLNHYYGTFKQVSDDDIKKKDLNIINLLKINQGERKKEIILDNMVDRIRRRNRITKSIIKSYSDITTSFISTDELADSWDKIALRDYAQTVLKALQIIEPKIIAISFVNSKDWNRAEFYRREREKRIPLVRIKGVDFPVPLKSMGDGIIRLFQLALRLYEAKDGFLLIDEFENGLHFGVQKQAWELVFNLAKKLKIQVFASTHSSDCIKSFSQVALEKENIKGSLFRINKKKENDLYNEATVTMFNESDLRILLHSNLEIR